MLPREKINLIIAAWFAKALVLYGQGLKVYAFTFLSNHFHLLIEDTTGSLAQFMCYFQGNVARAINKDLGRHGKFWGREYDDVIVDGEAEFWDRYGYTMCNAVKSGLVDKASEWVGFNSLEGALTAKKYSFEVLNLTKFHNARRQGKKVTEDEFMETFEFELSPPPMWSGKTKEEQEELTREFVESAEQAYRARRENKRPLGVRGVFRQSPFDRPENPSFRPRIKVLSFDKQRRKELLEGYRQFNGLYREIIGGFYIAAMKGRRPAVEWPEGSYPPSCLRPRGNALAS